MLDPPPSRGQICLTVLFVLIPWDGARLKLLKDGPPKESSYSSAATSTAGSSGNELRPASAEPLAINEQI